MLGIYTGLFCSIFYSSFCEVMVFLSFLVPLSMILMYKNNIYLEDVFSFCNDMNMALIFMSVALTLLIMLASWAISSSLYKSTVLVLLLILSICFSTSNLLWFYIMFESSLLPILFMIIGWGYQPERLQAGLYMILYTVFGSLPLLIIIMYILWEFNSMNLYMMMTIMKLSLGGLMAFGFLAFLVKLPVYSMHTWLPKAHVEAPLGGSMILAGVLLKLGGYGLYIFSCMVGFMNTNIYFMFLICLAMWGGFIASLVCMAQSDIKSMIAYSSIVHMSLVVLGCLSNTSWGFSCALITMVAHGWTSSALFLIAYITYEKINSRSFNYTKGILNVFPVLSFFWFILVSVNMAVPPTINLVGELCSIPVAMWMNIWMLLVLLMLMFISVAYNMYLYSKVNHGPSSTLMLSSQGFSMRAMMSMLGHLLPLLMLFSMQLLSPYTEICM